MRFKNRSATSDRSPSSRDRDRPMVAVRGLEKSYVTEYGETHALTSTSFDLAHGEFLSVVGPSGCGKSTLLMLIAGLIRPSNGSVIVNGDPVERPVTDLGIVFQADLLMEWRRAIDNILVQGEFRGIPKKALRGRALDLLHLVGLEEFTDAYPHELSGGMRQRVALCRALVHDPPLLLMDEPFGALDALTRDQLASDLQNIWAKTNTTVLFITHSIQEAIFLSDRVLVFGPAPGRVVDEVIVDLPRPRRMALRETSEFGALVGRVRDQLTRMGVIRDDSAVTGRQSEPIGQPLGAQAGDRP